ncbi:MAG: hypothetical protein GX643_14495 [Acidimicrobiales bacterium]|nr:hypothetical protein [Acidimicrobiales bacterium]
MTDDQAQTIPLAGSTLVRGGEFEAEFKWFTVGNLAFVKHAIHSARDLTPGDVDVFGQTLSRVADGLAEQGVAVRYGVERPVADPTDPVGAAVADAAGLEPTAPVTVLRRKLPIDADEPARQGATPTGRPVRAETDGAAWSALVATLADFPSRGDALDLGPNDFATVVEADDGSSLLACCWARTMAPAAPGSPTTTEIVAVGVAGGVDAATAAGLRRAAVVAMADLVGASGVRTLAIPVSSDDEALTAVVEDLGFVARRSRQQYVRPAHA